MKKLITGLMLMTGILMGTADAATSVSYKENYGSYSLVSSSGCNKTGSGYFQTKTYERTVYVIEVTSYTPDPGQNFTPYTVSRLSYTYPQSYSTSSTCYLG